MKIITIRPHYDDTTAYTAAWANEIVKEAKSAGIKVFDLPRTAATRGKLESYIYSKNPELILFNGHGSNSSLFGQDDEVLVESGVNEELFSSKMVYAMACNSAKDLGPKCINAGANVYIGYELPFFFWIDPKSSTKPLKDELASPCFNSSNAVALSLLKGNTAEEAFYVFERSELDGLILDENIILRKKSLEGLKIN